MTPEQWQQIEALVEAAQLLPPEERESFLKNLHDEDTNLFHEVDSLLHALQQVSHFLETPLVHLSQHRQDLLDVFEKGKSIGAYRIEGLIGQGGMGSVYLATRADDAFNKKVAIKFVNPDIANQMTVRRFQRERQILAGLEHPNIARLLDGGTTSDGLPFLVMEYVDGMPIDQYCDQHQLSIADRIRLFLQVCSGVQYAHRKLLVHRDLKPPNILVDGDGIPKLLDFGIAKILDPENLALAHETTRNWQRPLTPDYASPEQIRGAPITTATDTYALGVVFYQLLTGHLPFRFKTLNLEEIERILSQEHPIRPSKTLALAPTSSEEDKSGERISRARGTTVKRLRSQLRGDLDNIVLMTLRRDPDSRYISVEQLAEDLRRHLSGLPVIARQEALGYRLSKFVRRNRLVFGFTTLLFLLATGFLLQTSLQARNLEFERDRAEAESLKSNRISTFLVDLLLEADPLIALGKSPSIHEVLLEGSRKLQGELGDQPKLKIELMTTLGRIYLDLGLFDEALDWYQQSLTLQRRLNPKPSAQLAAILVGLGRCYEEKGSYKIAAAVHREGLTIHRTLRGDHHPEVAESLYFLARAQYLDGQLRKSEQLLGRALDMQRNLLPLGHLDIARSLDLLGYLSIDLGAFESSEKLLLESHAIRQEIREDNLPDLAQTLNHLATLRNQQGRAEEAIHLYRQALEIRQGIYATEHPLVAESLNNLANALVQVGQYEEAIDIGRRVLTVLQDLHGEHHRYVLTAMHNLGDYLRRQGSFDEAEQVLRQALEILPVALSADHPGRMYLSATLGKTLLAGGKPDQAEPYLRTVLELRRRIFPPGHPQIASALTDLGSCLSDLRYYAEAETLLRNGLDLLEASPSDEPYVHAHQREALGRLIVLYERLDQSTEAEALRLRLEHL